MADRGSANGTVQATGNGPGAINHSLRFCPLPLSAFLSYFNFEIDIPTYFRASTNSTFELTAALFYTSAAAVPTTLISSDQGAAAAEVNSRVSQAFSSDPTGGTFFTAISTVDTNCAILPIHAAQLSPLLSSSSREVSPVSSKRAGFNFGHLPMLTAAFYSSAAASPSTPISSGQGTAAAEVNACVSQACSSDPTGGTSFTDISTMDTNRQCRRRSRLSKYLKYAINCLDLACTKAGLRAAKSIASVAATIAVFSSELLQSVDLRSSSGFRFSDGLCSSKMTTSGVATDLRTTSTSSLDLS